MWIALILGLTGSVGHCSGMCSGIVMLLHRSLGERSSRTAWALVHGGRLLSYSFLGFLAGWLGLGLKSFAERMAAFQGIVAILTALLGIYFVLTLIGLAPNPEILFPGLVSTWRKIFQRVSRQKHPFQLVVLGMTWGLLPCGLVITALFTAAVSAAPLEGALHMAVFGLATVPVLITVTLLSINIRFTGWSRYGAAVALALFSLQIGMRGMAAFGVVDHLMIGKVMLW